MNLQEKLDKRMELVTQNRKLNDAVEARDGVWLAEETEQFDKRHADIDALTAEITAIQESETRRRELDAQEAWDKESRGRIVSPAKVGKIEKTDDVAETRKAAFRAYLEGGKGALNAEEVRALQADSDTGGGYTIPDQFMPDLIRAVDNATFIRSVATVHQVNYGVTLRMPSLDNRMDVADWTPEIGSATEDTNMTFGTRSLSPHKLTKLVKVSNDLINSSALNMEQLVLSELGYQFGITAENVYMNGTGAGQPLGLFTASDDGISTTYDVSTGNTSTSITFQGLKSAKYDLLSQYWPRASWVFNKAAVQQISKLQDGNGQYIWQASVVGGDPDMLLGFPMRLSEYAPSTFTSGLYVGILGDFSFYHIAEVSGLSIQRVMELYAVTDQTGFIGRQHIDGMPVLGEAFRRVKLG